MMISVCKIYNKLIFISLLLDKCRTEQSPPPKKREIVKKERKEKKPISPEPDTGKEVGSS